VLLLLPPACPAGEEPKKEKAEGGDDKSKEAIPVSQPKRAPRFYLLDSHPRPQLGLQVSTRERGPQSGRSLLSTQARSQAIFAYLYPLECLS
jgi:hypothetical protein